MKFYYPNREMVYNETGLGERLNQTLFTLFEMGAAVQSRLGGTYELPGVSFDLYTEDFDTITRYTESIHFSAWISASKINQEHEAVMKGEAGPISQQYNMTPNSSYADAVLNMDAILPFITEGSRNAIIFLGVDTCWTSVQLFNRNNRLCAVFSARSVDAVNGLIPDLLFWHRLFLIPLAKKLGLAFQGCTLNIGSLHYYAEDSGKLRILLNKAENDNTDECESDATSIDVRPGD